MSVRDDPKGLGDEPPLFCDMAEEIRRCVEAYDAGYRPPNGYKTGYKTVYIGALRRWAEAMERASLLIEGPSE